MLVPVRNGVVVVVAVVVREEKSNQICLSGLTSAKYSKVVIVGKRRDEKNIFSIFNTNDIYDYSSKQRLRIDHHHQWNLPLS